MSLTLALLYAVPQASAGPPGDVQHVCLSVDYQTAVVNYDLAPMPDNSLQLIAYEVSSVPVKQVFIRAVLQGFPVQVYDPPNYTMKLREVHNRIQSLINQNHQKAWLKDNRICKNTCRPLDPPHY